MKLVAHGWALELLPSLGGAVGALSHHGNPVLRPTGAAPGGALDTGCFPLVPYANRIADGRFDFAGDSYALPRNFGTHPHSIHGVGWQSAWTVDEVAGDAAVLTHDHDGGGGWPWRYRAEQRFVLAPGALRIDLSLTNCDHRPMPAGLGLHPYFPCDAATRLGFSATRLWLADATMLPTVATAPDGFGDWTRPAPVMGDMLIDNAWQGWDGHARIDQCWGSVILSAQGAGCLHLYRPPGQPCFCVEPVSHLPDAINRDGMAILAPGATARLTMTLTVVPPGQG